MFETTKDWFYLVLSVCVTGVSVFLCVALYNLSRTVRQINFFLSVIRTKVENAASLAAKLKSLVFNQLFKGLSNFVSEFSQKNKKAKTKNK